MSAAKSPAKTKRRDRDEVRPARRAAADESGSAVKQVLMQTGPSGLLLGVGSSGVPLTVRLFRPQPTRVLVSARAYMQWILIFRGVLLGAHVTILTQTPEAWDVLRNAVLRCGGTIDVTDNVADVPGQGRPYRPSLVVDDTADSTGVRMGLGAWQAVLILNDLAANSVVHTLRACDMTIASGVDARGVENLRRGYVLNAQQLRLTNNMSEAEIVVALPRRLTRVSMPPTPVEYDLLFS